MDSRFHEIQNKHDFGMLDDVPTALPKKKCPTTSHHARPDMIDLDGLVVCRPFFSFEASRIDPIN